LREENLCGYDELASMEDAVKTDRNTKKSRDERLMELLSFKFGGER